MRKLSHSLAVCALACLATTATAKEGADQYPNGAENWLAGALPPPGTYYLNYFGYYSGDLRNGDGKRVSGASAEAWFNAFRVVHVSGHRILGGNWGWYAILPVVSQKVSLGSTNTVAGLGDATFDPFVISWHADNWHWATGMSINLPTGRYKEGDPTQSIGANYWSIEPLFAVSYLNKDGWELSAKFMYNIKSSNKDFRLAPGAEKMEYASGDEFHVDYLVGKRFGAWGVGLSGYYLTQINKDKLEGHTLAANPGVWSEGRRGRVFAIGPSVTYTNASGVHFIGQWQRETGVENRFGGDKLWFKAIMPL